VACTAASPQTYTAFSANYAPFCHILRPQTQ
jgi:hypothetical protein